MFSEKNNHWKELSKSILMVYYTFVSLKFVNSVIFTCLWFLGNLLDLKNREIWNLLSSIF